MKKFFLSFFVIATSAGYALSQYFGGSSAPAAASVPVAVQTSQTSSPSPVSDLAQSTPLPPQTVANTASIPVQKPPVKSTPIPAPTPTPVPAPKPKGQYVDGTYTGGAADAYYGMVQIQATVSGGKLANVTFLQYPSDRSTSRYINSQAMPYLTQEAIQAQSAQVDVVSGATDTSMAFQQSLGDALSQAKS